MSEDLIYSQFFSLPFSNTYKSFFDFKIFLKKSFKKNSFEKKFSKFIFLFFKK